MNILDEYSEHRYPIISHVSRSYADADLSDVLLLACQHLLEPQLRVFELLIMAGLKPTNCIIAGKCYSTNSSVLMQLKRMGCTVAPFSDRFDPMVSFDSVFVTLLESWLSQELSERNLSRFRRIIVLDDGGYMHEVVSRLFPVQDRICGVEQTSSGKSRIERLKIDFCRHMVASHPFKQRDEALCIGTVGASRIAERISRMGMSSPCILVLGLGTIGRNVAARLYLNHTLDVSVADLHYDDPRLGLSREPVIKMFEGKGLRLDHREAMRRLGEFNVIIGASGSPALTTRQITEQAYRQAVFMSMSSGDIEFPYHAFRTPHDRVHSDCYKNGRCLVNAGFPVTFTGRRHEIHPLEIELTMALLQASVMDLVCHPGSKPVLSQVIDSSHQLWKESMAERDSELVS